MADNGCRLVFDGRILSVYIEITLQMRREELIKKIDGKVMDETSLKALSSERLRMNCNFHELADPVQRMLNAIEPGSYIQPHRHLDPPKVEVFLCLRGKGALITFDDEGVVEEVVRLEAGGNTPGVEVPPGVWHSIVSLEEGTVFFEVKDGPYVALTDKDFAPWAPKPGEEGCGSYLEKLKSVV